MKSVAVRKHLKPMVLGIVIGLIAGTCLAIPALRATGTINHRMYYSITCVLRHSVDFYILTACLVMYVLHVGLMLKGWLKRSYFALAGAACLGVLQRYFDWLHWVRHTFRDFNVYTFKAMISEGFLQIAACGVILVLGIMFMRRMRGNASAEAVQEESPSETAAPVVQFVMPMKHTAALYAAIFVIFLGLNTMPALVALENARDMRNAPNIIYIMVDTLRADHLGCYGYSRNTSPNIDKFASQSIRFGKVISQAPWTTASISSFMSSRYLHVTIEPGAVPSNVTTMPELLKDRGYETGAIISNALLGVGTGLERGYEHFYEMPGEVVKTIPGKRSVPSTVYSKAVDMLNKMKNRRFFMFVHFMGPHSPYVSHKEYNFYPDYRGKLPRDGVYVEGRHYQGDDLKYAIAMYDGEIAETDHYIGMLLDKLKEEHLYKDTLIVFLADHGEEFEEHGKMSHGKHLYDETISVPLIIKLPGEKKGSVVHGVFPLINLLPTITNYIHCDTSAMGFQGAAVPLEGLKRVRESDIYSSTDFMSTKLESLRSEKNKLILDDITSKMSLYDLKKDPGEKRNIASESPETTSAFQSELRSTDGRIDAALKDAVYKRVTPTEARNLGKSMRALGYLQ